MGKNCELMVSDYGVYYDDYTGWNLSEIIWILKIDIL